MSANNYTNFFYPPPNIHVGYTEQQQQQQQHWNWKNHSPYLPTFNKNVPPPPPLPPTFPTNPPNHINHPIGPPRPHGFHNAQIPRHFAPRGRFNSSTPYFNGPQQSWLRTNYKRTRSDSGDMSEPKGKVAKKRKKPLSHNVPAKKGWSMQDAEKALHIEKEYNKRFKNHSLIIKFPDLEINKEIVSKFHDAIDNVHFQQPSTARYCFVTLQESANADVVISALNKQKFGDGYLTAEFKKDREDDHALGPNDIDPLTLYVGNLAQEITKDDMVKTFPKCKRIDIGYAKKMKYTRYAFVAFTRVVDSIEAFKKTHNTEMYSKSLIVRFRRLHGTVGMPGMSTPQNPPKNKPEEQEANLDTSLDLDEEEDPAIATSCRTTISPAISDSSTDNVQFITTTETMSLTSIKEEPTTDDDDDDVKKPLVEIEYQFSPLETKPKSNKFIRHRPKVKTEIKTELKAEIKNEDDKSKPIFDSPKDVYLGWNEENEQSQRQPKQEQEVEEDYDYQSTYEEYNMYNGSDDDDDADDNLQQATDFDRLYKEMGNHASIINSLKESTP